MPDPRERLIAEIQALARTALEIAPGAASVLLVLVGAMKMNEEDDLAGHVGVFSEKAIIRINSKRGGHEKELG